MTQSLVIVEHIMPTTKKMSRGRVLKKGTTAQGDAVKAKRVHGKVRRVMHEYKEGKLHSRSKKGPLVKSRKQAIAIALHEAEISQAARKRFSR